ncbi:MAG: glycoside hydrolase family 3 C-terminal domain-containing protein [Candidatus Promineifilaceae bacterium]
MTDIEQLLSELTTEEKISLLGAKDTWHTVPIPRLGIPSIKVSDGPNGVRGAWRDNNPPSICIPIGIALGATWNRELVKKAGGVLANEVKRKGAHVLLAPTVNIHRTPIAGRNFECYSEDPYLNGQMATAYINGLQENGVSACIKHFVANDQEFERNSISSEVDERPLQEIYLEPFRIALKEANPWTIMSSYNRVNGEYASENDYLLKCILKDRWGYDGLVMSDWFGTYSAEVPGGWLDVEMPGPARWMSAEHVQNALDSGDLTMDQLNDKVRRILRTAVRVSAFDKAPVPPEAEQGANLPEERTLIREIAQETIVLLTNKNNALPLDNTKLKKIAVIGELAKWANILGGGSSEVKTHYVVSPLEGILGRVGEDVEVVYEPGCFIHKFLPDVDRTLFSTADGQQGLDLALYDNLDFSGDPVYTAVSYTVRFGWFELTVPKVNQRRFTMRLTGYFTPKETGLHSFALKSIGQSRLSLDGEWLMDNWDVGTGFGEKRVQVEMTAGQPCTMTIEFRWDGGTRYKSVELGHLPPQKENLMESAVAAAESADVAIVVAGLTQEWEAEGFDRINMDLPGDQNELIDQVSAVNSNTIVVLNGGSPLTMPWLDKVSAVVDQWYNSQECGNALADVLFGNINPSGKLSTTFPVRLEDNPAYINYPGENGKVRYGEGIFVGYRYYDKKKIEPLFPFGHGLSYTTFEYGNLQISSMQFTAEEGVTVSCDIHNTGPVAGKEVVQLYVHDVESILVRPEKELKAFTKVALEPGETKTVVFQLDQEAFWYYNPARSRWQVEPGAFDMLVGASSRDIRLQTSVELVQGASRLHTGLSIGVLLRDDFGRSILENHFGSDLRMVEANNLFDQSLDQLAEMIPDILSPAKLAQINVDLSNE